MGDSDILIGLRNELKTDAMGVKREVMFSKVRYYDTALKSSSLIANNVINERTIAHTRRGLNGKGYSKVICSKMQAKYAG